MAALPIPSRPWRVIADQLSKGTDPGRILELAEELNAALDRADANGTSRDGEASRIANSSVKLRAPGSSTDPRK